MCINSLKLKFILSIYPTTTIYTAKTTQVNKQHKFK